MFGWGRRFGWWGRGFRRIPIRVGRFTYVGPCRCGFGPHAFYVDDYGRLVHAWELPYYVSTEEDKSLIEERIKDLEMEKKMLEEEIMRLKKELERSKRE
ncbi:hypothetical protein J422_02250 [Methanocaldococcus villosus KIN24-T80]|uniref:DUF5320 domain-containing protein n=1 Tax=Methanocaldococcus villosus KIN24-T80 TaxID=1069083 RepID=N6V2I5_9EURY|nr:hypothetical protein [Methanocaldococcus villosus]ENN96473.1 hypothetical protein J422_02250 [Methanocaldococcus villosus KIN24-T80]